VTTDKIPRCRSGWRKIIFQSIRDLAEIGATEVFSTKNQKRFGQYSALAIFAGARTHAKFLIDYSADELLEVEKLASEVAPSSPAEQKASP
jgi:hypothetical protein